MKTEPQPVAPQCRADRLRFGDDHHSTPPRRHRHDVRRRRRGARAAAAHRAQAAFARRTRVTWVLQPGAATLVRGHWAVDEIIEFDRSRGWRAYPAVRRGARAQAVRRRARAPGLLQGGHRHVVHARADQARLRSRAGARPQLALHHRPAPGARGTARAGSVLRVPRGARHSARAGDVGSRAVGARARVAERVPREVRSAHRADRRRHEQAGEGLDARALGRGERCALWRLRPAAGARGRTVAARARGRACDPRSREGAGVVSAGKRPAQSRRHPRRRGARPLARHRAAAHDRRAQPAGDLAHGLHEPQARRAVPPLSRPAHRRVRRSGRGLSALDGEPAGPHGAHRGARRARQGRAVAAQNYCASSRRAAPNR